MCLDTHACYTIRAMILFLGAVDQFGLILEVVNSWVDLNVGNYCA